MMDIHLYQINNNNMVKMMDIHQCQINNNNMVKMMDIQINMAKVNIKDKVILVNNNITLISTVNNRHNNITIHLNIQAKMMAIHLTILINTTKDNNNI